MHRVLAAAVALAVALGVAAIARAVDPVGGGVTIERGVAYREARGLAGG